MSGLSVIDTHAHLDDQVFDRDRDEVYARAAAAGVRAIINVGFRPARWPTTIAMTETYSLARHMLGIHPQHAGEWSPAVEEQLVTLLEKTSPVAVGEIGFDYFRDGPSPEQQHAAFVGQVAIADRLGLPIVIHQRAGEADLIEALTRVPGTCQVLLHSFEGTNRLAKIVIDRRFYVGVGGLATRAGSVELRQTLGLIPLDQIVLETDAPYLVPAGVRDRRNTPANVPLIAERLAPIWDEDQATLAAATTANAERLFDLRLVYGQRRPNESLG